MTVRQRLLLHLGLQTALWGALCALLLHLGQVAYLRWDLTRDARFSVSDGAVEVVRRLEDPVQVRVWFSEDLEPPYHGHRDALLDLLSALDAASGGKVSVRARDPAGDPALQAEAHRDGVDPIPYTFRSAERAELRSVYLGLAVFYRDRSASVDALPSIARMEYEVVRAIDAVATATEDKPVLGWWLGHGEPDPTAAPAESPLRELYGRLSARTTVRRLAEPDAPIPEEVDVLLIAAPRSVPADDLVHLDQFVMRGGRVLIFASSFAPDFARLTLTEVDHGLYALLGAWGLELGRDLVVDRAHAERLPLPVRAPEGVRMVPVEHPLAPVTTALDRVAPAVRRLPRLVLPFASTLSVVDPLPEGVEAEVWATTDSDAVAIQGLRTLDPQVLRQARLSSEVAGPHGVVVALSGRFPSPYPAGGLPPRRSGAEWGPIVARGTAPARVVVVSSADAVANDLDLVTNAVDWLVEDPVLIGLRSRLECDPPLPALTRGGLLRAKLAMVGAPLALLALAGLVFGRRRS